MQIALILAGDFDHARSFAESMFAARRKRLLARYSCPRNSGLVAGNRHGQDRNQSPLNTPNRGTG
jgi:hypothetical protein